MKMPKNLYDEIRYRIQSFGIDIPAYRASLMPYQGKDIEKRIRWDLLWMTVDSQWICDNIYPLGMNDTHIDTALRKIVRELEGV